MKYLIIFYLIFISFYAGATEINFSSNNREFKINTTQRIFEYISTGLKIKLIRNQCSNRVISPIEKDFLNIKNSSHYVFKKPTDLLHINIDKNKYLIMPNSKESKLIESIEKRMLTIEKEIYQLCQK